jgi:hypothetical protein
MRAWDENVDGLLEKWRAEALSSGDFAAALESVLNDELPKILILGIEKMLDGPEVENTKVPPELKDAYSTLLSEIGNVQ